MRVVLLSFDFGEYSIRLASALAQSAEVLLLLPIVHAKPYLHLLDPAVHLKPFNKPRLRQPFSQLQMIRQLIHYIRAFQPDVIHLQQGHFWTNLALPLLRSYPLVLTIHDPQHHAGDRASSITPQQIFDFGFRRATRVIVHAEQLKQEVLKRLALSEEKVDVVPHIAVGGSSGPQVQEHEGTVLFFGRIWPYKGLDYLIRAEPLITAEVPDVKIVIAGEGEDFSRYRSMMVHPERFCVYNEYISEHRAGELFQQASVIVLPYVEASQSGVIPVAYSYSKPVIATAVGGLPEVVEHGETGYLIPPRDERALAVATVRLLKDRSLRQKLGSAGKRKLETEYAGAAIAAQTLTIYRKAIEQLYARKT